MFVKCSLFKWSVVKSSRGVRHLLLVGAIVFGSFSAGPNSSALADDAAARRLDQIVGHLQDENPNRRAAAERQLRERIGREDLGELRAYVRRPLDARTLRVLGGHLHLLVANQLDEVELEIDAFDGARQRVRQLVAERERDSQRNTVDATDPTEPNAARDAQAKKAATRDREIESLRRDRDTLRDGLRLKYRGLLAQGLALGEPVWRRLHEGGGVSLAVLRFREKVVADLVDSLKRTYPSAPAKNSISPYERRALAPFIESLSNGEAGWAKFREELAVDGVRQLSELKPGSRRDARALFLQLDRWGVEYLDSWAEAEGALLPTVRQSFAAWNRYSVPVDLTETSSLDMASFEGADSVDRLRTVYRLEWVGAERSIPILARILELDPDLSLKVEAAASLARLSDSRGLEFLRALGLEGTVAVETVSRRVLLLEAIHRREAGELDGAIEDLQALLRRFPGDHRLHYELGFTALQARRLELAIEHFLRALEFKADDQLAHYNLACAYALSKQRALALNSLRAAVEFGFADPDHLENDGDLQSLKEDNDFQKLVERLRGSG